MSLSASTEDEAPAPSPEASLRTALAAQIRALHAQAGGLSRVHRTHAALYAQARRAFGSWREAVRASGFDYRQEVDRSLTRGLQRRDERRHLGRAVTRYLTDHPAATLDDLAAERPELASRVVACWGDLARAIAWLERPR
ncbi:MAG: hypothetical protein ABIP29_09810 [Candidatus Eisenbacteria bacterium]